MALSKRMFMNAPAQSPMPMSCAGTIAPPQMRGILREKEVRLMISSVSRMSDNSTFSLCVLLVNVRKGGWMD